MKESYKDFLLLKDNENKIKLKWVDKVNDTEYKIQQLLVKKRIIECNLTTIEEQLKKLNLVNKNDIPKSYYNMNYVQNKITLISNEIFQKGYSDAINHKDEYKPNTVVDIYNENVAQEYNKQYEEGYEQGKKSYGYYD